MSKPVYLYDLAPECAVCDEPLDELYPFCAACADSITREDEA